jgi:hypothetical protein
MRGALIYADEWQLNVVALSKSNTVRVVVEMNLLRLMGNEGEATIGDPRDFNSYRVVEELLEDSARLKYSSF